MGSPALGSARARQGQDVHLVVDAIPTLVWSAQPNGSADFFNQRWLEYTGLSLDEALDCGWKVAVHPDDLPGVISAWTRSVEAGSLYDVDHRLRGADGAYHWFHARGMPLRGADEGRATRWYVLLTDVHERKQVEDKLRRSERSLQEAQRLGRSGSWSLDMSSGVVSTSPEMFRAFDVQPGEDCSSPEFWFGRIHPDDRKRIRELFERCVLQKTDYEADYRLLLPDGTIKYQRSIGYPILNQAGGLVEFAGTAIDTTEQVKARAELEKAFAEINLLKDQLYNENLALRDEVDRVSMFEEIVGTSNVLEALISRVIKVSQTDATVLITGETGTGKELIARAVHKRSRRSQKAFVSVNCAALAPSLISSELFGHEKGAFTGAMQRRLGRFELANGGTIFLDEVGELPLETQVVLLRVLQEREFERVGGKETIQVDVRVIAATNRNLETAMLSGTFRSDLYYRLSVFPIEVPPLRERKDDVVTLLKYFVDRFARKMGKRYRQIEKRTMELLESYDWPGNIRELQNVVERSVIVSSGDIFCVDEAWLSRRVRPASTPGPTALEEDLIREQRIIQAALAECRGRISGPNGAAAKLRIPPSTLDSKIKRLKISKSLFKLG